MSICNKDSGLFLYGYFYYTFSQGPDCLVAMQANLFVRKSPKDI